MNAARSGAAPLFDPDRGPLRLCPDPEVAFFILDLSQKMEEPPGGDIPRPRGELTASDDLGLKTGKNEAEKKSANMCTVGVLSGSRYVDIFTVVAGDASPTALMSNQMSNQKTHIRRLPKSRLQPANMC